MPSASSAGTLRGEINIAPLVDVAMVLLIIFMAAAPLLQTGYDVALPRPAAGPSTEPIRVTLDSSGNLRLNDQPVELSNLEKELSALLAGRRDSLVFLEAEDEAGYGRVVETMDVIRKAGGRIGIALTDKPVGTTEFIMNNEDLTPAFPLIAKRG